MTYKRNEKSTLPPGYTIATFNSLFKLLLRTMYGSSCQFVENIENRGMCWIILRIIINKCRLRKISWSNALGSSRDKSEEAASDGGYPLIKGNLKDIVSSMTVSQDLVGQRMHIKL